jgi:hypothetical protein
MGGEYIFYMLDDAIALLPEAKLRRLIENYMDATEFCAEGTHKEDLLADAKAFQEASLSGSYYNGVLVMARVASKTPSELWLGSPIAVASSTVA